jgi:hypothetical protein
MIHTALPTPCPPQHAVHCEPEVQASATFFSLRNKKKSRNFIIAELTTLSYFQFYVENLRKDGTGCPGWWLFQVAWDYFVREQHVAIQGIRGDWTFGDNLDTVNRLTSSSMITLEQAAKQTWTYRQASSKGFTRYQYLDAQGSPGNYTEVQVLFLP